MRISEERREPWISVIFSCSIGAIYFHMTVFYVFLSLSDEFDIKFRTIVSANLAIISSVTSRTRTDIRWLIFRTSTTVDTWVRWTWSYVTSFSDITIRTFTDIIRWKNRTSSSILTWIIWARCNLTVQSRKSRAASAVITMRIIFIHRTETAIQTRIRRAWIVFADYSWIAIFA